MVVLPYALPAQAGWELSDRLTLNAQTPPAVGGVASVELPQLDPDERWLIEHMTVSCSSSTATALRLYETSPDPRQLLDGSASGNFDVADWPTGLLVEPSGILLARWTGASDGAVGWLRVQVRVERRS